MKANAPWRDRPSEVRQKLVEAGRLAPSAEPARKGLHVSLFVPEEESKEYVTGLYAARNQDMETLDEINQGIRTRREAKHARLTSAIRTEENARKRTTMRRSMRRTLGQQQYRTRRTVPKGKSAVAAFEKAWKGQRSPIVEFRFAYDKDLTYDIWLEVAHGGRYGIISRAIDHWGRKFMGEVKKIATLKQYRDKLQVGDAGAAMQQFFDENNATDAAAAFDRYVEKEEQGTGERYSRWSSQRAANKRANQARYRREKDVRAQRRAEKRAYHEKIDQLKYRRGL